MRIALVGFPLQEADGEGGANVVIIRLFDIEAGHDCFLASLKIDLDEAEYRAADGHAALPSEREQVQVLAVLEPLVVSLALLNLERIQ